MIRCQHRRLFVVEAVEANHWLDATNALHEGLTEFQHLLFIVGKVQSFAQITHDLLLLVYNIRMLYTKV